MISMNQVWDDTVAFVRREAALLFPLALATLYVGDVVVSLAAAARTAQGPTVTTALAIVAAAIWSVAGQLAIVSLVLRPGQSVGEALTHGVSRLGKVLLIALFFGLIASLAMIPIGAAVITSGVDLTNPQAAQNLPMSIIVVMLLTALVLGWLGLRLLLMNALIVDRNPGVVETVKDGFALTRGIAARLLLVILVYVAVLSVVGSAIRFVSGSVFALVGAAIGSPFAGDVFVALITGLISTLFSLVAAVFLAMLYRRVARAG